MAPELLGGDVDVHELRARRGEGVVDGHRLPKAGTHRDEEIALAEPALHARRRPQPGLSEIQRMVVRERIGAAEAAHHRDGQRLGQPHERR